VDLLLQNIVFLSEGCKALGLLIELGCDGHQPSYEVGEEGEGCCFRQDEPGQGRLGEVAEIAGVQAKCGPGKAQLFCR